MDRLSAIEGIVAELQKGNMEMMGRLMRRLEGIESKLEGAGTPVVAPASPLKGAEPESIVASTGSLTLSAAAEESALRIS